MTRRRPIAHASASCARGPSARFRISKPSCSEAPSIAAEEEGPEIDVSLDDADEPEAIEIEPVVLAAKSEAAAPTSRAAQAAPPAGQQPTRIAGRHGFREPLEVKLDGETALLVDVSTSGAQVLSSIALKPNKLVKMLLPSSEAIILCKAKIIWARFEPPTPGKPVRYRAGMVFTQADPAALQMFITRHSGVKMTAAPSEERKTGRLIPVPFNTAAAAAGQRLVAPTRVSPSRPSISTSPPSGETSRSSATRRSSRILWNPWNPWNLWNDIDVPSIYADGHDRSGPDGREYGAAAAARRS